MSLTVNARIVADTWLAPRLGTHPNQWRAMARELERQSDPSDLAAQALIRECLRRA